MRFGDVTEGKSWDRYLIREQVELRDRTGEMGAFLLAGPQLPEKLNSLRERFVGELHPLKNWPQHAQLILFPHTEAETTRALLTAINIVPCSLGAWEIVRVEAGLPQFGIDLTQENLPQEVHRNAEAISFTKGCYLGQETVARIDALGHVNKLLCRLAFNTAQLPLPGTELFVEGKAVAKLTSVVWSPKLSQPLALGYVRRGFETPGSKIEQAVVIE